MFNLIVGFTNGAADAARMLEYTSDPVREYVAPEGRLDASRLLELPTLVMPETGDPRARQVAQIGRLEHLTATSSSRYRFRVATLREIASTDVEAAADDLGIDTFEFRRTHWAVKDKDL